MAVTRKIIKRRIDATGTDIDCEENVDIYFDLKDDKKTTYEQGRGRYYRKTVYSYKEHSTKRKYEDDPLIVKNPEDESVFIPYHSGVIKSYPVAAGRGRYYRKTKINFDNTESNTSRRIRVQTVFGTENGLDYVEVERVKSFKVVAEKGRFYKGKRVNRKHEEQEIEAMDGPCKTDTESPPA